MKYIKILLTISLLNIYMIMLLPKALASNIITSDNGKTSLTITEETTKNIFGMTYTNLKGTTTNGITSGNQNVNVLSMKTDGINSKLVSWAIQRSADSYGKAGLTAVAEDYEKKHPGWIVLGGVNGDQFYATYGSEMNGRGQFYYYNQPYYPLTIDNETRFAISPSGNVFNCVGAANDGRSNSFIKSSNVAGIRLEVIDEAGNILTTFPVNKVNSAAIENEIAVWFPYNSTEENGKSVTFDVNNEKTIYLVEKAELAYMSNSRDYNIGCKVDTLFGRGVVTKITNQATIGKYQFAVETSNEEVAKKITENTRIRVEYYYENDELNNVDAIFGYHTVQRMDDKDVVGEGMYNTMRYDRSVFGRKADGTFVLLTTSRGEYSGSNQDETNAMLKYFGVVEAYQQDGGGSVTAIARNETGGFDLVCESSNPGMKEISIFDAQLFVIRDPGYRMNEADITRDSITLTKVLDNSAIKNLTLTVGSKTYNLTQDSQKITGLEEDTDYLLTLNYQIEENGITVDAKMEFHAHTAPFTPPESNVSINTLSGSYAILETSETDTVYQEQKAEINGITYDLLGDKKIFIGNLEKDTIYTITICSKVFDSYFKKYYDVKEEIKFTTLNYDIPYIEKFTITRPTKNSVKVDYSVIDNDGKINIFYIVDEFDSTISYFPETLSGSFEFNDLDIENKEYSFKLIIQTDKEISSDSITVTRHMKIDNPEGSSSNGKFSCKKGMINIVAMLCFASFIYISLRKKH